MLRQDGRLLANIIIELITCDYGRKEYTKDHDT